SPHSRSSISMRSISGSEAPRSQTRLMYIVTLLLVSPAGAGRWVVNLMPAADLLMLLIDVDGSHCSAAASLMLRDIAVSSAIFFGSVRRRAKGTVYCFFGAVATAFFNSL